MEERFLQQPVAKEDYRTAYKKLPTGTKTAELRYLGNILYEIKCKWENKVRRIERRLQKEQEFCIQYQRQNEQSLPA
jgi:hypothetical protein